MARFDLTTLLAERRRRRRHADKPGIGYLPFPNLTRVHRIAQQASCQHCQRWRYRHEEGNFAPLPPDTPVVAADVPYGAGPSWAGDRIYIDPAIPTTLQVGGVELDLHHAIALHERVEYVLMHEFGMPYADAHVIATAVEYNYVAQCGADVTEYERLVAPYVHQARDAAERGGSEPPADLDWTPYEDEDELELVGESMSAIAYSSRSEWEDDAYNRGYSVTQDGDELYAVQFDPWGKAVYVGWSPSSAVGYLDSNSGYIDRGTIRNSIRESALSRRARAECMLALTMLAAARALVGHPLEESAVKLTETAVQSYFKRAGMQVQMDGDYVTVWTSTDKDYWDATQIYQGLGPQASGLETVEDGDLFGIRFKLDQADYPVNGDLASKPEDYDNVPSVKPGENSMPENKPGGRLGESTEFKVGDTVRIVKAIPGVEDLKGTTGVVMHGPYHANAGIAYGVKVGKHPLRFLASQLELAGEDQPKVEGSAKLAGKRLEAKTEASLSRRHFEDFAKDIRWGLAAHSVPTAVENIAREVADTLHSLNSSFDREKFIAAATRPLGAASAPVKAEEPPSEMLRRAESRQGREAEASRRRALREERRFKVGDRVMFNDSEVMRDTIEGDPFVVTKVFMDGDIEFAELRLETGAAATYLTKIEE